MNKILLLTLLQLTACASMIDGSQQQLTLSLPVHVTCSLSNDKGAWPADKSGNVMVIRSEKPLLITCNNKMSTMTLAVASQRNDNVMLSWAAGGYIGASIDHDNGSAYEYPSPIEVKEWR